MTDRATIGATSNVDFEARPDDPAATPVASVPPESRLRLPHTRPRVNDAPSGRGRPAVDTPVTVHVFGDVRVWTDGTEVVVPNPRARQLLTALVVARGTVVGTHDLVEFLWHAAIPRARRTSSTDWWARSAGCSSRTCRRACRDPLSLVRPWGTRSTLRW